MSARTIRVDVAVESRAFVGGDAADLLDLAGVALDRVRAEGLTTIDDLHLYPCANGRMALVLGPAAAAEALVLAWAAAREGVSVLRECSLCERAKAGACRLHRAAMLADDAGAAK